MNPILDHNRLSGYRIDRSLSDAGTLFQSDTLFSQKIAVRNCSATSVCRVSAIEQKFSSHAGTHADCPKHFLTSGEHMSYEDRRYQGDAVIVDVGHLLGTELQITPAALMKALAIACCDPKELINFRILLHTNTNSYYPKTPCDNFPYLSREAAQLIAEKRCPMIAIDTPSIDYPQEKCLSEAAHGILHTSQTAIVENIDLSQQKPGKGTVITFFDAARNFEDARGIACMLFIPAENHE